jgi:hypothetical protein
MLLITAEQRRQLPAIGSTSEHKDPYVWVKLFCPWSNWTWFCTEFDGKDEFFGLVQGLETELGYFYLHELESITGPGGLKIERDKFFQPCPLSSLQYPIRA